MKRNAVMRAVAAMPFAGKNYVRNAYMGGQKAVRQNRPRTAEAYASAIDTFAKDHESQTKKSAAIAIGNLVIATRLETLPPAINLVAGAIAGAYALANCAVMYNQHKLADGIRESAAEVKDVDCDVMDGLTSLTTSSEASPAAISANQPTTFQSRFTRIGHYANTAMVFPIAFSMGELVDIYNAAGSI
ncbi:MAG: hypothetical protein ABWX94_03420 [Candidatus Saccharimonadales bacterium]